MTEPHHENDCEKSKKARKRKKGMYKTIVKQMEFYLGDANVSKSTFMTEHITKPWMDLDLFLKFNKLVGMLREFFGHADNSNDLWTALKAVPSEVFEIREDSGAGRQIRRKKPPPMAAEPGLSEAKTIYVERLPPNVTIEMLRQVFDKFGEVSYVSLPRFKHNRLPKGFAFVEFQNEDSAKNSIEAFVEAKRKISCMIEPGELQSIRSYHIEKVHDYNEVKKEIVATKKKIKSELLGEDEPVKKKVKLENEEVTVEKNIKIEPPTELNEPKVETKTDEEDEEEDSKSSKKKRKRKQHKEKPAADQDPLTMLQIMPKAEWKRLRNKYLTLQRKNIAHTKMKLRQYCDKIKEEVIEEPPEEQEEEEQKSNNVEFIPGIIVKFTVDDPIEDDKKVKQRIRAAVMESVNYVDARIGAREYFVRCAHNDQAKTLANAKILGQAEILEGQAEKDYWNRIMQDREAKLSGKVKSGGGAKKQRGKMRIVKKFHEMQQKENAHKYFNDEDDE